MIYKDLRWLHISIWRGPMSFCQRHATHKRIGTVIYRGNLIVLQENIDPTATPNHENDVEIASNSWYMFARFYLKLIEKIPSYENTCFFFQRYVDLRNNDLWKHTIFFHVINKIYIRKRLFDLIIFFMYRNCWH